MQSVNLKKAHKLVKQLKETAARISFEENLEISVYAEATPETIKQLIDQKVLELNANFSRYCRITNAVYAIRARIDAANQTSGISQLLNALNNHIDLSARLPKTANDQKADTVILAKKLEKLATTDTTSRFGMSNDSVTVSVAAEGVSDYVRSLKKNRSNLEDQILAANIATSIALDTDCVSVLQENDLLD